MTHQSPQDSPDKGLTPRAVIIALILVVLLTPAAFWGEIVFAATYMYGSGVPGMAPLAVVFFTAVINWLVGRFGRGGLSRREVLTFYSIVLVGAPLVTHGILVWMLTLPIFQYYQSRAVPQWEVFLDYVPTWFAPTDPQVVENYFQGAASVPWEYWLRPAWAWSSFMLALFLATLCLIIIFRRQWIMHERLSFPIAQVPLEIVTESSDGHRARPPVSWFFWIGFLISAFLINLYRLAAIFPNIPNLSLTGQVLMQWQPVGPLAGLGAWELWLPPWMVAIAFLIPKELSFSCWFFWLVRIGLTVLAISAGATPQRPEEWWSSSFPASPWQGGGAVMAIAFWTIWVARHHLKRALLSVIKRGPRGDDPELMNYRWAILGFILAFSYLVYFYWQAGSRVGVGLTFAGLIVINYMVWARLRAETGLGFIPFPLIVNSMVLTPFGSGIFRPREIVSLYYTRWSYFPGFGESFEVVTGNSLEAFKIADAANISTRKLSYAIIAGFLIALVVGVFVVITGMYHYGFLGARGGGAGWMNSQLRAVGTEIFQLLSVPGEPDINGAIAMGAGALFTLFLGFMRLRFWWWPFHPIGYLAAFCWGMHWFSQAFFLGWLLKSLVIRYGGLPLYRRLVPLAIGLVAGDFVTEWVWVTLLTIMRGAGMSV